MNRVRGLITVGWMLVASVILVLAVVACEGATQEGWDAPSGEG